MEPVNEPGALEKHQRAFSRNNIDAARFTVIHGLIADRACSRSAIHPHVLDAGFCAIASDLFGDGWRGHQQDGVNCRADILQSREASPPLDLTPARMHRHGIVPASQKFAE